MRNFIDGGMAAAVREPVIRQRTLTVCGDVNRVRWCWRRTVAGERGGSRRFLATQLLYDPGPDRPIRVLDKGSRARHSVRVLGHLGLNVADLAQARSYWAELMPVLGFEPHVDHDDEFAYRPAAGKPGTYLFFYPSQEPAGYSRHRTGLQHLAFMVPTRQAVHDAHATALRLASIEVHAPQEWPQYPQPYFAAFWLDPFGFMIEAVCHHDR